MTPIPQDHDLTDDEIDALIKYYAGYGQDDIANVARAAYRKGREDERAAGWMSIETAPDGPALVYFADGAIVAVKNAATHVKWLAESGYQRKGSMFDATRWMPLPTAPETTR